MWHHEAKEGEDAEPMDTSDSLWCWYYLAECGRWHRFEDDPVNPLVSGDIEQRYVRDPKGVLKITSISCIKIDFSAMLQTDLSTGRPRRIQRGASNRERRCCCFNAVPVFWEKADPLFPYQLVPLSNVSPEYQTVTGYVKGDGLLDNTIVSVHRIQNLDLWELFCRKKIQLMRIQGVREIQERRLFHGTKKSNVHNICTYNFDFRLAGSNGHSYGKGTYFARFATFADKYSDRTRDPLPTQSGPLQHQRTKILFIARVIIGRFTVGQKEFQKPDHGTLENAHDSCVDDAKKPSIFVIFDPNQIYPEYLVEYS